MPNPFGSSTSQVQSPWWGNLNQIQPAVSPQLDPVTQAKQTIRSASDPDLSFLDPTETDYGRGREAAKQAVNNLEDALVERLKSDLLGAAEKEVDQLAGNATDLLLGDSAKKIGDLFGESIGALLEPVNEGATTLLELRDAFEERTGLQADLSIFGALLNTASALGGVSDSLRGRSSSDSGEGSENLSGTLTETEQEQALDPDPMQQRSRGSGRCPYDAGFASDGSRCGGRSAESRGPTPLYD